MDKVTILWVDDEIDLLKPQILFLEEKGYQVKTATNGEDALEQCKSHSYDLVFLDEQMPGLSGLETLSQIKSLQPAVPVVMVTKSEEEGLMDEAIGSKIDDYLIKPVKPNQVLLSIKKQLDDQRLITEKSTHAYQQEFREISMALEEATHYDDWKEIYRQLVYWELELEDSEDENVGEILAMQKQEANREFSKFIKSYYPDLINLAREERPVMSDTLFREEVFPCLQDRPVFVILIDNLRYDQWRVLQPTLNDYFDYNREDLFYSILPTTTQYSRNSIFAGLMPRDISQSHPEYWKNDDEKGGKNEHEQALLAAQLEREQLDLSFSYHKIIHAEHGQELKRNLPQLLQNDLNVIVYNFVDMLSHARTEMEFIKELAHTESAYRDLTLSWFEHSPLSDILRQLSEKEAHIIFTTDHGTLRVRTPSKVIGDRNTTTNLRYKHGKNLQYDPDDVLAFTDPEQGHLPRPHVSSSYIFALTDKYFVYPNNYHYYVNYFKHTFQHGGISLEEMLVPVAHYQTK